MKQEIINNKTISHLQTTFIPKVSQESSWRGRFIQIGSSTREIFISVFKFATSFFPSLRKVNEKEDKTEEIQLAKKNYRDARSALAYVKVVRLRQAIEIIQYDVNLIESLLKSSSGFKKKSEKLIERLDKIKVDLQKTRKSKVAKKSAKVFKIVHAFYSSKIKPEAETLKKGSIKRKQYLDCVKTLVGHVNQQQKILNKASSDPYLQALQRNERLAKKALDRLRK